MKPERFDDASAIADHLNAKRTVVLNLESTNKDISRRLVDFLSGVAYANNGQIKRVANSTLSSLPITWTSWAICWMSSRATGCSFNWAVICPPARRRKRCFVGGSRMRQVAARHGPSPVSGLFGRASAGACRRAAVQNHLAGASFLRRLFARRADGACGVWGRTLGGGGVSGRRSAGHLPRPRT